MEQNPVDAEEVAALAERLAGWQEELAVLRRRERVYARTLREINTAEQATMQRATRYLERRMVGDIARITDGRYKRVRVDDADLGIDVFSPERNDWVPVSELSQGTLDVVYLAARLGPRPARDRRPPAAARPRRPVRDARRRARAAGASELLSEVAGDFQVIYLTTSDRYDALADKVVVLDGPTAADGHVAPRGSRPWLTFGPGVAVRRPRPRLRARLGHGRLRRRARTRRAPVLGGRRSARRLVGRAARARRSLSRGGEPFPARPGPRPGRRGAGLCGRRRDHVASIAGSPSAGWASSRRRPASWRRSIPVVRRVPRSRACRSRPAIVGIASRSSRSCS